MNYRKNFMSSLLNQKIDDTPKKYVEITSKLNGEN